MYESELRFLHSMLIKIELLIQLLSLAFLPFAHPSGSSGCDDVLKIQHLRITTDQDVGLSGKVLRNCEINQTVGDESL